MKSVQSFITKIDTEKFPEDKLKYIDVEGLQRYHVLIKWEKIDQDVIDIIRDLLMTQYSIKFKWLKLINGSFEYVAQKTVTNGDNVDPKSAYIQIEPLNDDYGSKISRIPINQKLEIGTTAMIEKSIPYANDEKGDPPDFKFLHSGNLTFQTKLPNPIINYFHIGSMEIGSIIRSKYKVEYVDRRISKFRLWNFRRNDDDNVFLISIWKFYGLDISELILLIIDYLENEYTDPIVKNVGANDYGANILHKEKLIKFLKTLLGSLKKEYKPITIQKLCEEMKK